MTSRCVCGHGQSVHAQYDYSCFVRDCNCERFVELAAGQASAPPPSPTMDDVESLINGPGYSIIRGWLAIHGGASARIVLEELTQMAKHFHGKLAEASAVPASPQDQK